VREQPVSESPNIPGLSEYKAGIPTLQADVIYTANNGTQQDATILKLALNKNKPRDLCPRANDTDRATAACR
jgi:hypothetical protein